MTREVRRRMGAIATAAAMALGVPTAGQTITLKFTGSEDFEKQTSFVINDTALNVS